MKLKSGGISRPFGNFVPGSLNSSKNVCAHACNGVILADGVYSRSLDTKIEEIIYLTMKVGYFPNFQIHKRLYINIFYLPKSIASGDVRALNTFCQGCALICGNLNSV